MKLSGSCPAVASMSWSILCEGKLSFGQALFMSVKSTHILHYPFFHFTNTTLATHFGYCTSLIDPMVSSFSTSSLVALFLYGLNLHVFWITGRCSGSMDKQCEIIFVSIPGISSCFHANTSLNSTSKMTKLSRTRSDN